MSESLAQFAARVRRLADGELDRRIRPVVLASALEGERLARQRVGVVLHVRTGRLRNSIRGSVRTQGAATEIVLAAGGGRGGQPVRYAAIHEKGGTIRAKAGGLLRIPMPGMLTGAGVDRNPGSLRGDARFRFHRGQDGRMWLVHAGLGGSTMGPAYRLVPQVTIPARPYLRPSIEEIRPKLRESLTRAMREIVGGGRG